MAFLPIFTSIIAFILLGVVVIYKLSQNPRMNVLDVPPNAPLIINYPKTSFTEKGYVLLEKECKENKNGTYTIRAYKIDGKQGENAPKPKLYKFVVLKESLKTISTNGDRIIKEITSKDAIDYPEPIRDTLHGKFSTTQGMLSHLERSFGDAIKEKDKAVNQMIVDWAGGETTSHRYGQMKEEVNSIVKTLNSLQKKEEEK